jgi:hypothetical protein
VHGPLESITYRLDSGMLFLRFASQFPLVFLIDISGSCLVQAGLPTRNDGIHLAIHPRCGPLSGSTTNVNGGINPWTTETIVAFGVSFLLRVVCWYSQHHLPVKDSYTDGGKSDGSPLALAVVVPPSTLAGGRSTNGLTCIEGIANDLGTTLKDYAVGSNLTLFVEPNTTHAECQAIGGMHRPLIMAQQSKEGQFSGAG